MPTPVAKPKPRVRVKPKAQETTNRHEPEAAISTAATQADAAVAATAVHESQLCKSTRDGRYRANAERQRHLVKEPFAAQESTPGALNALFARTQTSLVESAPAFAP